MGAGAMPTDVELAGLEERRAELRGKYLKPSKDRPSTPGRGIHHAALICSDVGADDPVLPGSARVPAGGAGGEP